ncbi:hypothetical protein OIDMADRAFT_48538 [Oidiodendron maius Zn]|uniref:Uncharacterized protein n=1 Tax=Oidiodendron maius (strain Zn) TaxID=913774 RepID=A0A0C3I0U5_OIDMZ|nr:hypothetical protein OIDMADRAFT_48538 [Oidiodendron maius Zn]
MAPLRASIKLLKGTFEKYMPPIKETAFPVKHTRIYMKRGEDDNTEAELLFGCQDDFPWNVIPILEFEDAEAANASRIPIMTTLTTSPSL